MALTDDQIKEALKSDAAKDAIKEAVEAETKGLKKKNEELLGKVKDGKTLEDRLEALEKEKEDLEEKVAAKSGDPDKVKQTYEDKIKKLEEKHSGEKQKLQTQLEKKVLNDGLTNALVKAKIAPGHMDAVRALIKTSFKSEIGDNDGEAFAKIDGKAVEEFVAGWAQTDTGKQYVLADNNSGGGSNGASGSGKAGADGNGKKQMSRTDFEKLSIPDRIKTSKEGVVLAD